MYQLSVQLSGDVFKGRSLRGLLPGAISLRARERTMSYREGRSRKYVHDLSITKACTKECKTDMIKIIKLRSFSDVHRVHGTPAAESGHNVVRSGTHTCHVHLP